MIYYIYLQQKSFLNSEESNELSIFNKFIISIIAIIIYLFFALITGFSVFLLFQKIIIQ